MLDPSAKKRTTVLSKASFFGFPGQRIESIRHHQCARTPAAQNTTNVFSDTKGFCGNATEHIGNPKTKNTVF